METLINNQKNQPQPPIDAVPTPPVLNGTPKKRNYIPWILGILVLVVLAFTSYSVWISAAKQKIQTTYPSSPTPTSAQVTQASIQNWKMYTNTKYGFSFKYPESVEELSKGGGEWPPIISITIPSISANDVSEKNILLFYYPTNKNNTAVEEVNTRIQQRGLSGDVSSAIIVDGTEARKLIEKSSESEKISIFIVKNNTLFQLQVLYNQTNKEKTNQILDQILSTFKFIDTSTNKINLTLPSGWAKSVEWDVSDFGEIEERYRYERIVLIKGNYKIEIGDPAGGGRANCGMEEPAPSILNNPSLSSVVKRTNPEEPSEATNLQICSNLGFNDDLDYGTKIGYIKYLLPANWDKAVLKEMDSIVESITLAK